MSVVLLANAAREVGDLVGKVIENGGEIPPELESQLALVDLNKRQEVDSAYLHLQQLEHAMKLFKARKEEDAKIEASLGRALKLYKKHIKQVMVKAGLNELEGNQYRYKLSVIDPKLVIEDGVEDDLKKFYGKEVTEVVLDKDRVRSDLESGLPVNGARLEPNYCLRAYPQKKRLAI